MPLVVHTIADARSWLRQAEADAASAGRSKPRVALVPTMGALHEGHLALVDRATQLAEIVVVSIFVNPLQFGEAVDLERYPRTIDSDVEKLEQQRAQLVFAPSSSEMYPGGAPSTRVTAGGFASTLEGNSRPGHFDGVLTVVSKLLNIVMPDVIVFGQKDAQQVTVVERMVTDLDIPVTVVTVPTVREDAGLALSSRNRFLNAAERLAAHTLPRALQAAAASASQGTDASLAAARSTLSREPLLELEYLAIVNPTTFEAVGNAHHGRALAVAAVRVGDTRLIDNQVLDLG